MKFTVFFADKKTVQISCIETVSKEWILCAFGRCYANVTKNGYFVLLGGAMLSSLMDDDAR